MHTKRHKKEIIWSTKSILWREIQDLDQSQETEIETYNRGEIITENLKSPSCIYFEYTVECL